MVDPSGPVERHLRASAEAGDLAGVRAAFEHDVNVNACSVHSRSTALHNACNNGWIEVVRELLKYKPDLDFQSANGNTALILAANNGHVDIVRLLSAQVPRPDHRLRNESGKNALDLVLPRVRSHKRTDATDNYVAISKILVDASSRIH